MRLNRTSSVLLALAAALTLAAVGCSGSYGPHLPSPDDGAVVVDRATASVFSVDFGEGFEALPEGLTRDDFSAAIDCGEGPTPVPTSVISVNRLTATGLDLVFIVDTTGSMGGQLAGVRESIVAFSESFPGVSVRWGGVEFGDEVRTSIEPTSDIEDFQVWVNSLSPSGGGDSPENPLDALMHAWDTFDWRPGVQRAFVIITDVGAHIPGDGTDFAVHGPEDVLSALGGAAPIYVVGPSSTVGYNVRELTAPTGGSFVQLPSGGTLDLTTLGIAEAITSSYIVTYRVPAGVTGPCDVIITVDADGRTGSRTFENVRFGTTAD